MKFYQYLLATMAIILCLVNILDYGGHYTHHLGGKVFIIYTATLVNGSLTFISSKYLVCDSYRSDSRYAKITRFCDQNFPL